MARVRPTKTVQVKIAAATFVQFQIGAIVVKEASFASRLIDASTSGLKYGLIIALAALGLSLIFGTTGLTNFAHGELITFGGIMTYMFNRGLGLPVIAAGVLAVAGVRACSASPRTAGCGGHCATVAPA